ncbi:hypothetical protein [Methanothrix sp.]
MRRMKRMRRMRWSEGGVRWQEAIYLMSYIFNVLVDVMVHSRAMMILIVLLFLSASGEALRTFSGDVVAIDSPVEDDVFAAGNIVSINAPVDSLVAAGSTVNINAPVKGDVIAAGSQVSVSSDVGGKVVAAGGTVNLGGDIGTNLVAAGGQVSILPGRTVARDALISSGAALNSGRVNGTLTVHASSFNNTGSAGKVDFYKIEKKEDMAPAREERWGGFDLLNLIIIIGYLILGLILVKYLSPLFRMVDEEIRTSTLLKTGLGFIVVIASFIALLLVAVTVVGLPIALLSTFLMIAALMSSGMFVSYSLGRWICMKGNLRQGDLVCFAIGFVLLNLLFLIPYLGGLVSIVSMSLGFAGLLYALRRLIMAASNRAAL